MTMEKQILELAARGIGVPAAVRLKGLATLADWVREQYENLEAAADVIGQVGDVVNELRDSGADKAERALTPGNEAPGPFTVLALGDAIGELGASDPLVNELRRRVTRKDWLQGVGIEDDAGALAVAAVFLAHGGKDGRIGRTEHMVAETVAAVIEAGSTAETVAAAALQDADAEATSIDVPPSAPDPVREAAIVAALEERERADATKRAEPGYQEDAHETERDLGEELLQLRETVDAIAVGVTMLLESSGITIPTV